MPQNLRKFIRSNLELWSNVFHSWLGHLLLWDYQSHLGVGIVSLFIRVPVPGFLALVPLRALALSLCTWHIQHWISAVLCPSCRKLGLPEFLEISHDRISWSFLGVWGIFPEINGKQNSFNAWTNTLLFTLKKVFISSI